MGRCLYFNLTLQSWRFCLSKVNMPKHPSVNMPEHPSVKMVEHSSETYHYEDLPTETSIRVIELLPGKAGDIVSCLLHVVDWLNPRQYDALSYTWGNPHEKVPIICHGKKLEVPVNLHTALTRFRYEDRSRYLWTDALW